MCPLLLNARTPTSLCPPSHPPGSLSLTPLRRLSMHTQDIPITLVACQERSSPPRSAFPRSHLRALSTYRGCRQSCTMAVTRRVLIPAASLLPSSSPAHQPPLPPHLQKPQQRPASPLTTAATSPTTSGGCRESLASASCSARGSNLASCPAQTLLLSKPFIVRSPTTAQISHDAWELQLCTGKRRRAST